MTVLLILALTLAVIQHQRLIKTIFPQILFPLLLLTLNISWDGSVYANVVQNQVFGPFCSFLLITFAGCHFTSPDDGIL